MKLILERPVVFFDLETTGLDTSTDRVVQIACIKYSDSGREEKKLLINPTIPIPVGASEVHGITDEMVANAPKFKEVSKAMYAFFQGCDIGGYNSNDFDIPLLMEEFSRCGITFLDWEYNLLDVYKYEKILNPTSLSAVYKRYKGKDLEGTHDALADVEATIEVFMEQTKAIDLVSIKEIDTICQGDKLRFDVSGKAYYDKDGVVRWSFGKNKDKEVTQDKSYLDWFFKQNFPSETKFKISQLLNPTTK